jgi:choline-sulfatase
VQNFVIFNPDEWRGDYAGCYGHPAVRTPNLDRLAAEGTRFDKAFVQHTVCSPSRCSFMTGWYPHVRGHRTLWHLLRPDEPHLFKYLTEAGYEVVWFGKNDLLAQESFEGSVTYYAHPRPMGFGRGDKVVRQDEPGYYSFLYEDLPGTLDDLDDAACVDAGIEFLRRPHDAPFCLFLPLIMPHCPYTVPAPYYGMYDPDDMPELRPAELPGKPSYHRLIRQTRRLDQTPERIFRKLNAVYCGMITAIDDLLGRVLDALDETGLADSTTVLVFSDHGDWAGDYGLVEKWSSAVDDCLTRVPFVVRTPGGAGGHVVQEQVEIHDQMATVLELAGIEARHTHFARSLVPQLRGKPGDPDRAVYAEAGYDAREPHCLEGNPERDSWGLRPEAIYYPKLKLNQDHPESVCRATMIRTLTHKLVRRPESGEHELYDLVNDPRELHNVHGDPEYADVQRELSERLLDWYVRTSDVVPFEEDPRGLPPHSKYWHERGV